jgi:AraC-like DNA-binding protein
MTMDPLSDVLSLLRPRSYMFRGLEAGGDWSLRFPATEGIRCYTVLSGECWLVVEDADEAVRLTPGDCVLLTKRQSFRLASDTTLTPVDAMAFFSEAPEGGVAILNGGGTFSGIGGYYKFMGKHAGVLLALLPPVVHIRKESDRARLRWSMEMMMQELRAPQPGTSLVGQHLGHMTLVLALRLYLAEGPKAGVGWLFALADSQMGAAINAMHNDPAHRWKLQTLADRACMSRSAFALKFKETVGEPPMEYLVRWRMMLAGDRLVNSTDSVTLIANSVGYESDSAFSAAFRRIMGCSPREYARSGDPDLASIDEGETAHSMQALGSA